MVDWEEWRADLKLRGVPDAEIEAVFAKYDVDGDMVLNATERRKLKEDLLKQTKDLNAEIEVQQIMPLCQTIAIMSNHYAKRLPSGIFIFL